MSTRTTSFSGPDIMSVTRESRARVPRRLAGSEDAGEGRRAAAPRENGRES